jgi:hypothetical protein
MRAPLASADHVSAVEGIIMILFPLCVAHVIAVTSGYTSLSISLSCFEMTSKALIGLCVNATSMTGSGDFVTG